MNRFKRSLTAEQAYQKIRHYCGYSERCHYEVREKLYSLGLSRKDVETLLTRLIEEDYLNEERYALLFAGGHFRQKKWGRTKIVYALRQKKVSEQNIKRALREINQEDYLSTLKQLASAKWQALKGEQYLVREARTTAFLQQKGYEIPAIQQVIHLLKSGS
jgi:regulatory protein